MNSAQAQSERYSITAVSTEELLACPDIDLVVNLTPVPAHETIIRKALERGKHVYSEKTLTESLKQSAQLLALAEKRGRLLCCAPGAAGGHDRAGNQRGDEYEPRLRGVLPAAAVPAAARRRLRHGYRAVFHQLRGLSAGACGGAPVWQKWRGRCWRDVRPCWTPDLPTIRRRSFRQFMTAARRDGISACAAICRGIVRRR